MDDSSLAQRLFAVAAIIVAAIGGGIFVFILLSPGGPFPSLGGALAIFTLGVTNGVCLPLVGTYWLLAGKPAGAGTLLILQAIGLVAFIGWYVSMM
ncbi:MULTISPECIES: hypothetical protein [Pseudomonas]|uniref:Uncharacterized protein n=1 Tax=Pseudomonas fluorescens TaxID=294 RepID=A0A5E6U293_PSEFL|nr:MULTISPECIES: hypothetical protein [Pseudomonas]VVM97373.1 hypothetical protein PS652_03108 [Pseudomonas fluorescens]